MKILSTAMELAIPETLLISDDNRPGDLSGFFRKGFIMSIEKISIKVLSSIESNSTLTADILSLSIVSIIGYTKMIDIMMADDFPEDKEFYGVELIEKIKKLILTI